MDTTNLDDLLNQAEAHEQNQNNWQMDFRYESKEFYIDEHGTVEIRNKTIGDMSKHISVKGESYSQYIEFRTNRFYDGVDLTKMLLSIYFEIPNVGSDENRPVNVYYNDNEIKFGWVIPDVVSQKSSTLNLCIYARGKLEDGKTYLLKTKTTKYTINDGLEIGSGIIEPTNNWYLNFVLEMDEKVAQANASADIATQSANKVDEVEQAVSQAYEEVSAMHTEVESMRDEVERMKDQVEDVTGIGIAAVDKLGVSKPDGKTIDIDEDGTLRCKVEGSKNYEDLENKPKINGVELSGDTSFEDLGFEGTKSYDELENKPSIAGVELSGEKTLDDLGIASKNSVETLGTSLEQTAQKTTELESSLGEATQAISNLAQTTSQNFETVEETLDLIVEGVANANDEILATNRMVEALETGLEQTDEKVNTVVEDIHTGFKKQAQGEAIYLTDATEGKLVEFSMFGKSEQKTMSGKNLIGNYVANGFVRSSGTYDNESFTVTRTESGGVSYYCRDYQNLEVGKTYTISAKMETAETQGGYIQAMYYLVDDSGATSYESIKSVYGNELTITLEKESERVRLLFGLRNSSAEMGASITFTEVQLEEGSVATEYESYCGGIPSPNPSYPQEIVVPKNPVVKSVGKNLLKPIESKTSYGITYTTQNDGTVLVNGETTSADSYEFQYFNDTNKIPTWLEKGKSYIASIVKNGVETENLTAQFQVYERKNNAWVSLASSNSSRKFTISEDATGLMIRLYVPRNTKVQNEVVYPMIRLVTEKDNTYEPYKESTSTIQGEYAGIKVASGGNYTDENGQQWICDEIVKYADGSGERVQRFNVKIPKSTDNIFKTSSTYNNMFAITISDMKTPKINTEKTPLLCTHFEAKDSYDALFSKNSVQITSHPSSYIVLCFGLNDEFNTVEKVKSWLDSNEVKVYYELAEPIITPLTAEEIAEIEKLSTFYSVTNISNDADCGMSMKYVGEGIITTNTEIPVVAQDGELESEDNIVVLFGKIKRMLENLNSRLSTLEQNSKNIVYSDTEPETVEENTIVMVYETKE